MLRRLRIRPRATPIDDGLYSSQQLSLTRALRVRPHRLPFFLEIVGCADNGAMDMAN